MIDSKIQFLISALTIDERCKHSLEEIYEWVNLRRSEVYINIDLVNFSELDKWEVDKVNGNIYHESKKFFSIEGIDVHVNSGPKAHWQQPIINQPEVGYLGMICKSFNGILHFLIQAKIEPGNINFVQLSPTLQATKSNYTKVHKGNSPTFLEYFNGTKKKKILLDQLQSEQGARFYKKRNRNIIISVEDDIPFHKDFRWVTLGQIKQLMKQDNLINMDTRTVISAISYGLFDDSSRQLVEHLFYKNKDRNIGFEFLNSAVSQNFCLNKIEEILSWITNLKSNFELDVRLIPLNSISEWKKTDSEIHHIDNKYFSVIAANVSISNREVVSWSQPLIKSAQEGLIGFIVKKIGNVYHFLIQAKVEAGNLDILELAPTVQCLTGNYRKGLNEYDVLYIDTLLNANQEQVLFKAMQSEEGGRFYQEQNLNIIVEVGEDFPIEVPENFCWMTLNQLYLLIQFNNYLNIQARSLISAISF